MIDFIQLLFALVLSAFFSGMELAFLSASRLQVKIESKRGGGGCVVVSFSNIQTFKFYWRYAHG
jgi:Mg2+/Co2+ transporter CorB